MGADLVDAEVSGQVVAPRRVGRQAVGVGRHAVVGVAERDQIVAAGVQAGHHHGQIVGLRAAVGEVHHLPKPPHPKKSFFISLVTFG